MNDCLFSADGFVPFIAALLCTVIILLIAVAIVCVKAWRGLERGAR